MALGTHEGRLDRLEQVVQVLAEDQLSLQKIVAEMATEMRRGFDQVAIQFAETDRRMRETDERMRETDERMRETDERMRATDERMRATDERIRTTDERIRTTDERIRTTDERIRATDERIDRLVLAIGELIRSQASGKN